MIEKILRFSINQRAASKEKVLWRSGINALAAGPL